MMPALAVKPKHISYNHPAMCKLTVAKPVRAPCEPPQDFTIGTLRKAIPAHCFERSALRSFAYVVVDLLLIALMYKATTYFSAAPWPLELILWPIYWFFQGAVATGVWVIAHECGHQAFSSSRMINDVTGFVLHSALLVPYFSWKHSHRRHHSNVRKGAFFSVNVIVKSLAAQTGSLEKDEVFVPKKIGHKSNSLRSLLKDYQDVPLLRLIMVVMRPLIGWPLYLTINASGRRYNGWVCQFGICEDQYPTNQPQANHFNPYSPIFSKRERVEILLSDLGLLGVLSVLGYLGTTHGWLWLTRVYIVPYLVVNHWLVTITYLQHTHPALPHYDSQTWDWLRGALSTVDRSYGFLVRISNTRGVYVCMCGDKQPHSVYYFSGCALPSHCRHARPAPPVFPNPPLPRAGGACRVLIVCA